MKTVFNNLAVTVGRKLASRDRSANSRALLIPPAVPGSIGDAAMISAAGHFLQKKGHESIDLMYGKQWPLDIAPARRISAEKYFYRDAPFQRMMLIKGMASYSDVYFVGADVIDGAYNPGSVCARLWLLAEAARMGKNATLLGSSYNVHPEASTMSALRNLPQSVTICARDPVSRERMESSLQRSVRQTADVAFLLPARPDAAEAMSAISWIEARRKRGEQVIGLNANYLHAEKNDQIPAALHELIEHLLGADLSIVLVPHDTRSRRSDQKLLADVTKGLSLDHPDRLYMLPPNSPGAIKAVLGRLDLLVSGRMHAAILAMSSGTPTFSFAYQDKFEGLYSFFDLENSGLLSSPLELVNGPEKVAKTILDQLSRHEQLRAQINQKLPAVFKLASENFK